MYQRNRAAQAGQGDGLNRTEHEREKRNHDKGSAETGIGRHAGCEKCHEHPGKQHWINHFEKHRDTGPVTTLSVTQSRPRPAMLSTGAATRPKAAIERGC